MSAEFKLPDLGEGIHEGEIVSILVNQGDQVEEGDPILEVETDKATVEIPSPFTGAVEKISVQVRDVVHVGDVLVTFSDGAAPPKQEPSSASAKPEKEEDEKAKAEGEEPKKKPPEQPKPEPSKQGREEAKTTEQGPVPASPATRRLARELGVDLHRVTPSGPSGRVTSEDVKAFSAQAEATPTRQEKAARPVEAPSTKAPTLPDMGKWGEVERIPLRSVRKATARQMALAWAQIPHVGSQEIADITQLDALRKKHKQEIEELGGRLTLTVFALKAAVAALKKFPRFNASLDMESEEIILKKYYHIGVAVDTPDGLIVPVIRDVDRKSIRELAVELFELSQRTRDRKIKLEEMQGGTFTITNIGPLGGTAFAPIINYPEAAILGLARASWQPVVQGDVENGDYEIKPRLILPIMLSFDHRVLDGADAERFLIEIVKALEDPERLLMVI